MAHAWTNTGGSQFFITFVDTPHLYGVHTVFGAIEEDDSDSFDVISTNQCKDAIKIIYIVETKD